MNGYDAERNWNECNAKNLGQIRPRHWALYFHCVSICNKLGWQEKFGLPSDNARSKTGITCKKAYNQTLKELIAFNLLNLEAKSKNQNTATIISLACFTPKRTLSTTPSDTLSDTLTDSPSDTLGDTLSDPPVNKLFKLKKHKKIITRNYMALENQKKEAAINKSFTPPTLDEVKEYFEERGYLESVAIKAFNHYELHNWNDAHGNQVKNWKAKMNNNWFKENNKVKTRKFIQ